MKTLFLFIVLALSIALLIGCVSTSLVYSPHVNQTGKTNGRGKTKLRTGIALVPTVESGDVTDATGSRDTVETRFKDEPLALEYDIGLSHGLGNRIDLGATLGIGQVPSLFGSVAFRPYLKFMLTPPDRKFLFSVMPSAMFIRGSRDENNDPETGEHEKIRSSAAAVELHFPASIRTGPSTKFTLTPHVVLFSYKAKYEHTRDNFPEESYEIESERDLTGVGLSAGFIWKGFHPEFTFLTSKEERPLFSVGIGVNP